MFRVIGLFMLVSCAMNVVAQETIPHDGMKMPGKLVNVGTHRLHIYCAGHGSPTVIIDSGLGGFSLEWGNVQKSLSESMQVCTYDRAGYGWSDPGPQPRTTHQIVNELHALLINAQISGPYILVGHSFGGYNVRYYASVYPEEVLGLVLVDASHPEQFDRMPQPEIKTETRRKKNSWTVQLSYPVIAQNYPEQAKRLAFVLMSTYKASQTQMMEWDSFKTSAQQVAATNNLPDVPLTVVTRGKRVWPHNEFGDKSELVWSEMQNELCQLTHHAEHLIAKESGHLVHLDEPDLVISAIISTAVSAKEKEEIRLAELQRKPALPVKDKLLLVSTNYLQPLYRSLASTFHSIYGEGDMSVTAEFVLPQ